MDILSLGEKIKKLRKEKNMTLKELAGNRITAAQISHIERDKSHTSYELLDYLSEKLEVSTDYLLETKEMQSKKITDNLILQSEIYIKSNELEKAEQLINQVLQICKEYKLIDNYGKCNFLLGSINLKRQNYNLVVGNFEKALYFFIKNNDKENIFKCYLNIGKIYVKEEFYKGAISHFDFAEEVLLESQIEDMDIHKDLYSNMAYCHIKLNQSDKSLEYIEKINKIDMQNNVQEEVNMLVLKAKNLLNIGKYDDSKECFKKALELLEEEENKTGIANVYLTICDIYKDLGDMEKVLEYSHKAYDIKKNDEDEQAMNSLYKIIDAYIESKDFDLAKKYCKMVLASSIKSKNKFNEYRALKLYSDMYRMQNENILAIEYLSKCSRIISELGDDKTLAKIYIDLGQLYSDISKEKELEYYQKGVSMYKTLEII
ncbi:helix-turn-helix domain-containing protein [Romboutsia sp.]|uniref:helix-turn-helix domain-containing protein n=1 Tax=Romboutsia sp. TaxID=1965302 RepID=UPI002C3C1842|nr:helix-turn-helix domain-containing protein [Romboutsia sp.]HSQ90112.1 helix-turn-helix domain-containing protein [Romboutsia sp.]